MSADTVKPTLPAKPVTEHDMVDLYAERERRLAGIVEEKTIKTPKHDLDLFSEREARLKGEIAEKTMEAARPRPEDSPAYPLNTAEFWIDVNAREEADLKGKPLPEWHPAGRGANAPPGVLDMYTERMRRRKSSN
jgi:hypothetical protein